MFGGIFHDYLEGPWEQVRGYLREELEQLHVSLSTVFSKIIGLDGKLLPDAFLGDATSPRVGVVYISNEGPHGTPKWAKVNLADGVKNRLKLTNFALATPNVVLGHGAGSGNYEALALGNGLAIAATILSVLVDNETITFNGDGELVSTAGTGGYIPLALGTEPLEFVSNGAGEPILISYTP